jgi:hypothetical protein
MADSVFRTRVEPDKEPEVHAKETSSGTVTHVEPPYTDYETEHGKPYSAEYFQLGDTWNDPNGGFAPELSLIEEFVSDRIRKGELPNNVKAVKEAIKKMEKVTNLSEYDAPIKKIEILSAYIKFLMTTDKIKFNIQRYGHH